MKLLFTLFAVGSLFAAGPAKLTPVDETGFQRLIAAHRGEVVLVDFWATWCKPWRAEMPELAKLDSQFRPKGLRIITISADEPEKETEAAKFLSRNGAPAPAYIRRANDDDRFISSVDAKWSGALPALFLDDRNGRKVKSFIGETPVKDIQAAVAKLL